ncbi:hypothetical protein ACJRO7_026521 [Eucalyptus globulus]|uniref:Secreted protein n=1 Tax=Eucalyptus globulus TaxID=34317 RepID=A0ABD3K0Z3_EUCGL
MVSHYFVIIFIVSAFYSIGGIGTERVCPFPPYCHCRPLVCGPPSSVQPPINPKWATSRAVEEPTPPNSNPVNPHKKPSRSAKEPVVASIAEEPIPHLDPILIPVIGEVPKL